QLPNRKLFQCMLQLSEKRTPIDTVTLVDLLGTDVEAAYVSALPDGLPHPRVNGVNHYVAIVKRDAARRRMIHEAEAIRDAAFTASEDPAAIVERAKKRFSEIE